MTTAANDMIRRYVEAVTKMLLQDKMMKPGLAIVATERFDPDAAMKLAHMAHQSETDVICLQFDVSSGEAALVDMTVVAPRDDRCFIYRGCRLTQRAGSGRARLLPRPGGRGHFEVRPGEIIHRHTQPVELMGDGIARAGSKLRQLVADGVNVDGQVVVTDLAATA